MRKPAISNWVHIGGLFTLLAILPANKVQSYPSLRPSTVRLDMSFSQCQKKATEIANLVFSEVQPYPANDSLQLIGSTSDTVGVVMCIKNDPGSYYILSVSSGGRSADQAEDLSIHKRINDYMLGN